MNIINIYQILRQNGFSSKDRDKLNDDRLGIKCSFIKDCYYCEIHPHYDYFEVHFMGGVFNPYTNTKIIEMIDDNSLNVLNVFLMSLD